jgi:hypothetical protein
VIIAIPFFLFQKILMCFYSLFSFMGEDTGEGGGRRGEKIS